MNWVFPIYNLKLKTTLKSLKSKIKKSIIHSKCARRWKLQFLSEHSYTCNYTSLSNFSFCWAMVLRKIRERQKRGCLSSDQLTKKKKKFHFKNVGHATACLYSDFLKHLTSIHLPINYSETSIHRFHRDLVKISIDVNFNCPLIQLT